VKEDMRRDPTNRRVTRPSTDSLCRYFEPCGSPCIERVAKYVQRYHDRYVSDSRVVLFDVEADAEGNEAVLSGVVGLASLKDGLIHALSALGFPPNAENLKVAPLSEMECYGLAIVPHTFVFETPTEPFDRVDQLLFGEPVLLTGLERDGFIHVQGPVGYLGWVRDSDVRVIDRTTWRFWHREERIVIDRETQLGSTRVSPGVELPVRDGKVVLPDQSTVPIPEGTRPYDFACAQRRRQEVTAIAENMLGTEYFWAGRHTEGTDCSGLVQVVYGAAGVYLPRDADQQHLCGRISGTPGWLEDIAPGDLLFFSGSMGNITHVGISLGGPKFIHAKGDKGVTRSSLDPDSDDYDEWLDKAFLIAKRIIR